MNDIIKVGNNNVPLIEWKGQRVITTALLAKIYEVSETRIKQNFNNNEKHFEMEKHYFLLKGEELQEFKNLVENFDLVDKRTPQLYLWTRRGASRHSKMLGTDKAWEQFDELEENYYNPQRKPLSRIELLSLAVIEAKKELEEKDKLIEQKDKRIDEMKPKEIFADAVSVSNTLILIGELAKIIKQNGIEIGQNRLFDWLRNKGYLINRKGTDYNMPTQKSMELELFEIKERTINNPDGSVRITKTVLVTGKGQQYFINKFLNKGERSA